MAGKFDLIPNQVTRAITKCGNIDSACSTLILGKGL